MLHVAFVSVKMNFCSLNCNHYMTEEFKYQCCPSIVIGSTRIRSCTDQVFQTEQVAMVSSIVHSKDKFCFLP